MKNFLKKLHSFATIVIQTLVSFISGVLFSSIGVDRRLRECICDFKTSGECVVMGNGPSLKSAIEDSRPKFDGKDIFAVNYFCLSEYFDLIKPNFYVLLDANIFTETDSRDLKPGNSQAKALVDVLNKIKWQMVLFVPTKFKNKKLVKSLTNLNVSVVTFNATPVSGFTIFENYMFKKNVGMPSPQTVINAVIFLTINMTYKKINLFGVEQSWLKNLHVTNNNEVSVSLPHFYSGSSDLGRHSSLRSLSVFLISQADCFSSHMRLQKYARYRGAHILNHTPGSYIDAYDRVL